MALTEAEELELLELEEQERLRQQNSKAPVQAKTENRFSELESAGLGGVQGLTMGFADEIEAGVRIS